MSEFETPALAPTGSEISAPPTPATPEPAAPPATPPAAVASPTTGAPPGDGWVPSYRIREAREAAVRQAQQEFAQREATIRAESDRYRQQLHSLVGVTPPADPEVEAIRQQFSKVYPGLSKLEQSSEQLMKLQERIDQLEYLAGHYWDNYGNTSTERLFSLAAEHFGAPLSEEGKRALHTAFVGHVQSNPEMAQRYASDPRLVEEFVKWFASSVIDPIRRTAGAAVTGRAPQALPQDTPGGAPRATPAPRFANLDERAAATWTTFKNFNNQHSGT